VADEAILRIVLEGQGGLAGGTAAPNAAGPPAPKVPGGDVFDPFVAAQKQREREEQKRQQEVAYHLQYAQFALPMAPPPTPTIQERAEESVAAQREQLELAHATSQIRQQDLALTFQRAEVALDAEREELAIARMVLAMRQQDMQHLENQAQLMAAQAEAQERLQARVEEIRPPAVTAFDPHAEAMRQINQERNQARVKAAKENIQFGPAEALPATEQASGTDMLKMAGKFLPGGMGNIVSSLANAFKAFSAEGAGIVGSVAHIAAVGATAAAAAVAMIAWTKTMEKMLDVSVQVTQGLASLTTSILRADTSASQIPHLIANMTTGFGDAVTSFGGTLAFISPVVGLAVYAFGTLIRQLGVAGQAFASLIDQVDSFVERYSQYSPGIATTQALAEVQMLVSDFRRAQEATPALMEYIKVRTELQQHVEDMKVRFLVRITPLLIKGMQAVDAILPVLEKVANGVVTGVEFGAGTVGGLTGILSILEWFRGKKEDEDEVPPDWINAALYGILGAGPAAESDMVR
jgi:hypothetical protein